MEQAADHAARDSALIGGSGLLLIAHEVSFLCSASLDIVDDHGGYEVTLPTSTDITGQTSPDRNHRTASLLPRVIEFPEVILPAINDTGNDWNEVADSHYSPSLPLRLDGGSEAVCPAITDIDGDWNKVAFPIVMLTLTALIGSLSAWFRRNGRTMLLRRQTRKEYPFRRR
ncbi:unnamed protein product [Zymoseptoria tritici ST99CH_3D7]|uniref:Uncharacterized protein n=1 Tax=Zymoseptoria tritici (strain ST99CH_3D7) TaxID=1276538 RepID=A0A1X7SAC0_ZYMT9|nr:unnamed protein product [Zymoseptoria tritici ST99CH_3D7]